MQKLPKLLCTDSDHCSLCVDRLAGCSLQRMAGLTAYTVGIVFTVFFAGVVVQGLCT